MSLVNDHAAALLALLRAASGAPPLVVFDGPAPDTAAPPYVVAWTHVRADDGEAIELGASRITARLVCHSVGANGVAARAVAGRVMGALLDRVPTVAGRLCHPIEHETSTSPGPEDTAGRQVVVQVDVYACVTDPA